MADREGDDPAASARPGPGAPPTDAARGEALPAASASPVRVRRIVRRASTAAPSDATPPVDDARIPASSGPRVFDVRAPRIAPAEHAAIGERDTRGLTRDAAGKTPALTPAATAQREAIRGVSPRAVRPEGGPPRDDSAPRSEAFDPARDGRRSVAAPRARDGREAPFDRPRPGRRTDRDPSRRQPSSDGTSRRQPSSGDTNGRGSRHGRPPTVAREPRSESAAVARRTERESAPDRAARVQGAPPSEPAPAGVEGSTLPPAAPPLFVPHARVLHKKRKPNRTAREAMAERARRNADHRAAAATATGREQRTDSLPMPADARAAAESSARPEADDTPGPAAAPRLSLWRRFVRLFKKR